MLSHLFLLLGLKRCSFQLLYILGLNSLIVFVFLTTNQWKRDVYILIHQSISLHYFLELTPVRLVPSSLYKKKKNFFKVPIISVLLNKMDSSEFSSYFTFQYLFIQMTSHSFFSKILELGFWDTILKIALQCCVCFCRTTTWIGQLYTCPLHGEPSHLPASHHSRSSQSARLGPLCYNEW